MLELPVGICFHASYSLLRGIEKLPSILEMFPKFAPFAVSAMIVGVPLTIFVGSELDINVEANPYNYKLTPGVWKEAVGPVFLELLVQLRQLSQSQNSIDEKSKSRIQELERRLEVLNAEGHLGSPRIKMRKPLGSTD